MELEFHRHINFTDDSLIKIKAMDAILENDDVKIAIDGLGRGSY